MENALIYLAVKTITAVIMGLTAQEWGMEHPFAAVGFATSVAAVVFGIWLIVMRPATDSKKDGS